jgi:hypothetical protein
MFKLNRERRAGFSEVESAKRDGAKHAVTGQLPLPLPSFSIQYKKVKIPERRPSIKTWTPRTQPVSITAPSDSPRGARTTLSTTSPIVPHHPAHHSLRPRFSRHMVRSQFPLWISLFLIHIVAGTAGDTKSDRGCARDTASSRRTCSGTAGQTSRGPLRSTRRDGSARTSLRFWTSSECTRL